MEPFFKDALGMLDAWASLSRVFLYVGYGLVIVGIMSSLAVTAFAEAFKPIYVRVLGFTAALCTAVLAALHPIDVGAAFRQAWRGLNQASIEYKATPTEEKKAAVLQAIKDGEQIIAAAQGRAAVDLSGTPTQ